MSKATLDSSANTAQVAASGFADIRALDQELAGQLPKWDLEPPHSFMVRKPRKPKPVVVPQAPVKAAPPGRASVEPAPVAQAPAVEIEADPAALAVEALSPETIAEAQAEVPVTDIEAEAVLSPVGDVDNCSACGVPLEPGSAFCSECGHKQ